MATEVTLRAIKCARFESEGFETEMSEKHDAFKLTIPGQRHPSAGELVFDRTEGLALLGVVQAAVHWLEANRGD